MWELSNGIVPEDAKLVAREETNSKDVWEGIIECDRKERGTNMSIGALGRWGRTSVNCMYSVCCVWALIACITLWGVIGAGRTIHGGIWRGSRGVNNMHML